VRVERLEHPIDRGVLDVLIFDIRVIAERLLDNSDSMRPISKSRELELTETLMIFGVSPLGACS
jgi:hypothetical protein